MNIAQLRTFVTVVEQGSFSAAARLTGLSQPAVTMQVQSLEADLGVTLLDRKYRKVTLTEAGTALVPHARRILAEVEDTRAAVDELSGSVGGRLDLAASTTPGQYVLPRLLGSFIAAYPEVGVSLRVMDTAGVVEAVESGAAHLGMTGAEVRGAKATFEQLGIDELVMIAPPDHPLAREKSPSIESIAEQPFVMREKGSGTRAVMERAFAKAAVDPDDLHVVTELGTGEAIVSAVEGGLGISVVSRLVAAKALELGTIAEVKTGWFATSRPFFVVTPRGTLTRATEAFLGHLRLELEEANA